MPRTFILITERHTAHGRGVGGLRRLRRPHEPKLIKISENLINPNPDYRDIEDFKTYQRVLAQS